MSIGDVTSAARGSGARYNDGKVAFDLIPGIALEDCARVFDYGRKKYAAWNWAKGMQWMVVFACLLRHLYAWARGEDNDPESKLPHLGHAMCNLVMLSTFARTYREGDDRPKGLFDAMEPVQMGGCAPPVYASPATVRDEKIAYDMATDRPSAEGLTTRSIKANSDHEHLAWHVTGGDPDFSVERDSAGGRL